MTNLIRLSQAALLITPLLTVGLTQTAAAFTAAVNPAPAVASAVSPSLHGPKHVGTPHAAETLSEARTPLHRIASSNDAVITKPGSVAGAATSSQKPSSTKDMSGTAKSATPQTSPATNVPTSGVVLPKAN